ncbi:UNVERIFIED_CONTAM: hypothetical protein FKN15_057713 [Acipenser sinensis]
MKTNALSSEACTVSRLLFYTLQTHHAATQSYSVGGQRSPGQLTGKPTGARPDHRGHWCAGEDVNRTLEGGRKPLHYAADCGQTEMVEFLLSKGADINAPDKHGITPLLSATYEGHVTCVKLLLSKVLLLCFTALEGVC